LSDEVPNEERGKRSSEKGLDFAKTLGGLPKPAGRPEQFLDGLGRKGVSLPEEGQSCSSKREIRASKGALRSLPEQKKDIPLKAAAEGRPSTMVANGSRGGAICKEKLLEIVREGS